MLGDVVLGCETLEEYQSQRAYLGCIVGRCAGRIRGGRFSLDGKTYQLATNHGPDHLHGGIKGFDRAVWEAVPFEDETGTGVMLRHTSADGDEGYPGTLTVQVRYTLTADDALIVDYDAEADVPTPVNLTQHSYFNLAGGGDVLGHELTVNADCYTLIDETLIPTGEFAAVGGTPLDFRAPTALGARIARRHSQLDYAGGYDHNFVIRRDGPGLANAARVVEPLTGRTLEVSTTEPSVLLYTGNFLDGTIAGKGGRRYGKHAGFCLETQHFPDSPNQPAFLSIILRPDEKYQSQTVFKFGSSP